MQRFQFIPMSMVILILTFLGGVSMAGDKVTLCHYPPGNSANWRIITVSEKAVEAHLAHGDLVPMIFYEDADGDYYGNPDVSIETCEVPQGFVDDNTDCDDTNVDINPEVAEKIGDSLDNDCNPNTADARAAFSGVLTDVPKSSTPGWSVCYRDTYNSGLYIEDILSGCTKDNIMLACSQVGSDEYTVVAHAPRDDVFHNTGNGNIPHNANGVDWYFSDNYSMGFAPEGYGIRRRACDVEGDQKEKRLCWHTYTWTGGWSCGGTQDLNYDGTWERIVLQAD